MHQTHPLVYFLVLPCVVELRMTVILMRKVLGKPEGKRPLGVPRRR
jgi:hypothetical protein